MLLNVNAVNEVVRLVTFTEIPTLLRNWYYNYLQLFTIKFINACSGFRQYQIFEEFPLWLWSLPHQSNSTCLVKDRSLKQSSEKNLLRTFSSKVGRLEIGEFLSLGGNPASFTGSVALSEALQDSISLMSVFPSLPLLKEKSTVALSFIHSFILSFKKYYFCNINKLIKIN